MRISDWSSDVCSSDLVQHGSRLAAGQKNIHGRRNAHCRGRLSGRINRRWYLLRLAKKIRPYFDGRSFLYRGLPGSDKSHRFSAGRSEEHTSELQSLMRISYAVFCLKKKKRTPHISLLPLRQHIPHTVTIL